MPCGACSWRGGAPCSWDATCSFGVRQKLLPPRHGDRVVSGPLIKGGNTEHKRHTTPHHTPHTPTPPSPANHGPRRPAQSEGTFIIIIISMSTKFQTNTQKQTTNAPPRRPIPRPSPLGSRSRGRDRRPNGSRDPSPVLCKQTRLWLVVVSSSRLVVLSSLPGCLLSL